MKRKSKKIQINKIRSEKGNVTTDTTEIKKNHQELLQTDFCQKL